MASRGCDVIIASIHLGPKRFPGYLFKVNSKVSHHQLPAGTQVVSCVGVVKWRARLPSVWAGLHKTMTLTYSLLNHLARPFTAHAARLTMLLACSLGFSVPAVADEQAEASDQPSTVTEVALHNPANISSGIRLKLHGIEDLRSDPPKADLWGDSNLVELKKQAQARYLAKKLRKDVASVRPYIDLAWDEASRREGLDPELLLAIMQKESGFRPTVQSRYGAQGLMQVVRRWHRDKLQPSESLFDPEVNVRVGADVLEEYLAQAGGDMDRALKKYSGNARGYVNSVMKEFRTLARVAEQAVVARG